MHLLIRFLTPAICLNYSADTFYISRPSIVDTVIDLVKGLQKEKMQRRQVIHPQVSTRTGISEE